MSPTCASSPVTGVCSKATTGGTKPFPITCNLNYTLPANSEVLVGGYVHEVTENYKNPCTGTGPATFSRTYCRNYSVYSVGVKVGSTVITLPGTIGTSYRGTDGELSEEALLTLPGLPNNAEVTVNFAQSGSDVPVAEDYCSSSGTVARRTLDADGTGDCN